LSVCQLRDLLLGQGVERGVDLVELPEPPLDLAVEVRVDGRAGGTLRDQADQLVDRFELVAELLDAAQALVAVADAARLDLAAALGARRVDHRHGQRQLGSGEAQRVEALLVRDRDGGEVLEQILQLEPLGLCLVRRLDALDEIAQLDVLGLAHDAGRAQRLEPRRLATHALAVLGLAIEVALDEPIPCSGRTECHRDDDREHRADETGPAKTDAAREHGESHTYRTGDGAAYVVDRAASLRESRYRGEDEAMLRGESRLHVTGCYNPRATGSDVPRRDFAVRQVVASDTPCLVPELRCPLVSGQLDQILAYLDRPGVTEIVIGNGRPITFRRNHENVGLTKEPLTKPQLASLIKGTPLYHLIPTTDGSKPPLEISVGTRALKITASRHGDEVAFKIAKGEPGFELELSPELATGRAKRSTTTPTERKSRPSFPPATRTKTPTAMPRTKTPTAMPRTKTATSTPRTKSKSIAVANRSMDLDLDMDLGLGSIAPPHAKPVPPAPFDDGVDIGFDTVPPKRPTPVATTPIAFQGMLERAVARNASDLHIATNRPISLRVLGELTPIDPGGKAITAAEADALLTPLLTAQQREQLQAVGYVDLALDAPGGGRLRTNISKFQGGLKGTFRIARKAPSTLDELNLPKELAKLIAHHQGLVVVAGPSGHGKTTTLAALVALINESRPFHIITVEDPIEIVYPKRAAVVSQREVGPHTRSFAAALKGSLREDPDVIVIGELRDRETVEIALTAAETGHLVIATMSTPSAAKTIDRLVDMFPPEDQTQVRASIAGALRAIVAQRLLPSVSGDTIYPAVEVLTGILALSAMIREDKLFQLPNLMQRGKAFGMIRFDDSLLELVRVNRITAEVAIAASENKKELAAQLGRASQAIPTVGKAPEAPKKGGLGGLFGRKDS
jgi:twitching motility protein PilT